ncbi:hypothetical protein BB561_001503 [Smittium simulii]|uniref:BZIP domain-containing protein n=1 Tax=Smittium simulii TaxID=133385 RepID=A0A2T9YU94_9FUNG|nr:hypothetical protein BB561_001503 [Smittium simulii]
MYLAKPILPKITSSTPSIPINSNTSESVVTAEFPQQFQTDSSCAAVNVSTQFQSLINTQLPNNYSIKSDPLVIHSGRPKKRGDGLDVLDSQSRKRARAARNRIAARKSRENNKLNFDLLKAENCALTEENNRLSSLLKKSESRRLELEFTIQSIASKVQNISDLSCYSNTLATPLNSMDVSHSDNNQTLLGLQSSDFTSNSSIFQSTPINMDHSALSYNSSIAGSDSITVGSRFSPLNGDLCESAQLVQKKKITIHYQLSAAEVSIFNKGYAESSENSVDIDLSIDEILSSNLFDPSISLDLLSENYSANFGSLDLSMPQNTDSLLTQFTEPDFLTSSCKEDNVNILFQEIFGKDNPVSINQSELETLLGSLDSAF